MAWACPSQLQQVIHKVSRHNRPPNFRSKGSCKEEARERRPRPGGSGPRWLLVDSRPRPTLLLILFILLRTSNFAVATILSLANVQLAQLLWPLFRQCQAPVPQLMPVALVVTVAWSLWQSSVQIHHWLQCQPWQPCLGGERKVEPVAAGEGQAICNLCTLSGQHRRLETCQGSISFFDPSTGFQSRMH